MKASNPTGDQPIEVYTCIQRRNLMKLLCLAGIIVLLFVSACDFRKVEAQTEITSRKESNMESIQSVTPIQQNIPPIDVAAVPGIETATFALG
jgi:hypothetical protein